MKSTGLGGLNAEPLKCLENPPAETSALEIPQATIVLRDSPNVQVPPT